MSTSAVIDLHQPQPRSLHRGAQDVSRHSEHQCAAGARGRRSRGARTGRRASSTHRHAERAAHRDTRPPRGLRRLARRAREPRPSCSTDTTTCSPSTRSSCGRRRPSRRTVRDGELYARGAADDKGQVFMHFKAIEAHMKQTGTPARATSASSSRVKRRSAAVNLDDVHPREQDRRSQADVVVISDSEMFDRGVPSICYAPAWPRVLPDRPARARRATCTRDRLAAPWRTRPSCWRRCSRR